KVKTVNINTVMECLTTITDKLQPNFFSVCGFLLNILIIPRIGITVVAHTLLFNEGNFLCFLNITSGQKYSPISTSAPEPVADFFKCENYTKLEKKLGDQDLVVLTGPPGSGKTQITYYYAKKFQTENVGTMYFKLKSASPEDIIVDCKKVIKFLALDIDIPDSDIDGEDIAHNKITAKRFLRHICEKLGQKTLLIFDGGIFNTACLIKEVFEGSEFINIKVIIILTDQKNMRGFESSKIEVNGYTEQDILVLAKDSPYNEEFELEDLEKLARKLDYSPLGIHAACQYIIDSPGYEIKDFLNRMDEGKKPMTDKVKDIVIEKNYPIPLIDLFELRYKTVCEKYKNDDVLKILNIVAMLSSGPIDFDILDWIVRASCPEKNKPISDHDEKFIKNQLIEVIKEHYLGNVEEISTTGKDDKMHKILNMHNVPKFAITSSWTEDERIKYFLQVLLILDDQVDKDTRRNKDVTLILNQIPHVKHALETDLLSLSRDQHQQVGIQILQIGLQDRLHHMYTQTGLIQYFKQSKSKAKQQFYNLLSNNSYNIYSDEAEHNINEEVRKLLDPQLQNDIVSDAFIKKKAYVINSMVQKLEVPKEPVDFVNELICTRRLNRDDVKLFQRKVSLSNNYLTEAAYNTLVGKGAAIELETMRKVFSLELLVSILYTHGRMYFYQNNRDKDEADEVYEHDLRLAYEISDIIHKEHGIKITTLLLAERNGFLYIDVDSGNEERMNNARGRYTAMLADESEYYEKGLRKIVPKNDRYHQMICQKQLVNYYTLAVEQEQERGNDHEAKKLYEKGCEEATLLLEYIGKEDYHNKAEVFIKIGKLKMTQLNGKILCDGDEVDSKSFNGTKTNYLEEAIDTFKNALELEKDKSQDHQRFDLVVDAHAGLAWALYKRDNKKNNWKNARRHAREAIKICKGKNIRRNIEEKLQRELLS
ncbi:unnamed protein product, partial [Owenia fusiformis]